MSGFMYARADGDHKGSFLSILKRKHRKAIKVEFPRHIRISFSERERTLRYQTRFKKGLEMWVVRDRDRDRGTGPTTAKWCEVQVPALGVQVHVHVLL